MWVVAVAVEDVLDLLVAVFSSPLESSRFVLQVSCQMCFASINQARQINRKLQTSKKPVKNSQGVQVLQPNTHKDGWFDFDKQRKTSESVFQELEMAFALVLLTSLVTPRHSLYVAKVQKYSVFDFFQKLPACLICSQGHANELRWQIVVHSVVAICSTRATTLTRD
jgi:hypothetical protein